LYETILFEKCGAVAKLALNRPKKLNAFDGIMHEDLYDGLDGAAQDGEVRCVVLQGEGKDFSARADLAQIAEGTDGTPDLGGYLRSTYSRLVSRMVTVEKPIVVALHGPVDGAGVAIALACDLRIAAENAKFSVAFIKIALMPDAGVSFLLPRIVRLGRAMETSMLDDAVEVGETLRIGLVNKVVPAERRSNLPVPVPKSILVRPAPRRSPRRVADTSIIETVAVSLRAFL
jgi:2-(1,2-epoxy-1,2-dihydrophenyl)acetyl-CoA isomerase